jgi:hypothetical protein
VKEIASALLKVQQELDPVKKDKKGHNNKYADLQSVLDEAISTCNSHGVVVLQPIQPATLPNHARVETTLLHAASGEQITGSAEVPWRSDNKMNDAQSYGSAVTYARRYSLVSMLGIATEDDDGQSAHSRAERPPAKKAPTEEDPNLKKAKAAVAKAVTALAPLDTYEQGQWIQDNPKALEVLQWVKRNFPALLDELSCIGVEI